MEGYGCTTTIENTQVLVKLVYLGQITTPEEGPLWQMIQARTCRRSAQILINRQKEEVYLHSNTVISEEPASVLTGK